MGNSGPKGQSQQFTDEQLREDLAANLSVQKIADKYGVSRQAVYKRVNQLKLSTISAAVAPMESKRHVDGIAEALAQLGKSLTRINLLMDACHEWLEDAKRPGFYDLYPRSEEVDVTYRVEVSTLGPKGEPKYHYEKRKRRLAELLELISGEEDKEGGRIVGFEKGEYKQADPRELILKTAQEARQTVQCGAELAKMLADQMSMEKFRQMVLATIEKADPESGRNISEALRRSLVLHAAFGGSE